MSVHALLLVAAAAFSPLVPSGRRPAVAARLPSPRLETGELPETADALVPMQDYVLVDLQSIPDSSQGGVLLPTVYYDFEEKNEEAFVAPKPRAGTVVAVGPGRRSEDGNVVIPMPPLVKGQKVVVGAGKGERVVLKGESRNEATHFLFHVSECARTRIGHAARVRKADRVPRCTCAG